MAQADVLSIGKPKQRKSEKLDKFLDLYVNNGGDCDLAFAEAGYSPNSGRARQLIRENWQHVQDLVVGKVGGHAPFALDAIVKLIQTAKSETVRLNAAKDILSRAGYDASLKIESSVTEVGELKEGELEQELLELLKKAGTDTSNLTIDGKEVH